jgi:hypothetical protein
MSNRKADNRSDQHHAFGTKIEHTCTFIDQQTQAAISSGVPELIDAAIRAAKFSMLISSSAGGN